jgi:uncharacterized protein (DUF779 family)
MAAGETQRIDATAAARDAIRRLRAARRGRLMFVQSAGCCAGSTPMCFPDGEYLIGDADVLLGEIEGCPFYIGADLDAAWRHSTLLVDVAAGAPEGFSLGPSAETRFITRSLPVA